MTSLRELINLGPKSSKWLEDIGIKTEDDLRRVGVIEAYCQLKARDPQKVNLMMLWAMQSALLGISYRDLPAEIKESLKEDLKNH
jgi:DNA transformation protein and related proteins